MVHSLAYGQRAEKSIAQLSRKTGGKTFYYSGNKESTAFLDGFAATIRNEGPSFQTAAPVSVSMNYHLCYIEYDFHFGHKFEANIIILQTLVGKKLQSIHVKSYYTVLPGIPNRLNFSCTDSNRSDDCF